MLEEKKQTSLQKNHRKIEGVVVSNKMNKTVVVKVDNSVIHPKYHKRYTRSKKYKCHDENNQCKVGDKVVFIECRPCSKEKRWRILSKV